jgi:hypothetical protein
MISLVMMVHGGASQMLVMPPLTDPKSLTRRAARLHLGKGAQVSIELNAGKRFSWKPCLELTRDGSVIVLRHERGGGVVRDLVLENNAGSEAKWIGHWLIRLDALRASIGRTTMLILSGDIPPDVPARHELARAGAATRHFPHSLDKGAVSCRL